jgi:hypothetical protein
MTSIVPVSTSPSARSTGSRARHLWRLARTCWSRPLSCDGHPAKCNIGHQWKDLDVPTVTAAGPPSSFPDQTPAPSVLCRTRAKSSHQCRRQSAATRLSLLPAQRGVPTPRHDVDPTPNSKNGSFTVSRNLFWSLKRPRP